MLVTATSSEIRQGSTLPAEKVEIESYGSRWYQISLTEKPSIIPTLPLIRALGVSKNAAFRGVASVEESAGLLNQALAVKKPKDRMIKDLDELRLLPTMMNSKANVAYENGSLHLFWEIPKESPNLEIREFADLMALLCPNSNDFVRIIADWQKEHLISSPLILLIVSKYIAGNPEQSIILEKLGIPLSEVSTVAMKVRGDDSGLAVQSQRLKKIVNLLPLEQRGVFDSLLLGFNNFESTSLVSIVFDSAYKSFLKYYFYLQDGVVADDSDYSKLYSWYRLGGMQALLQIEGVVHCSSANEPHIKVTRRYIETLASSTKATSTEFFEQLLHLMCYDI